MESRKSWMGFLQLELSRNDWVRGNEAGSFDKILNSLWNGKNIGRNGVAEFRLIDGKTIQYHIKFEDGVWWFAKADEKAMV